MEGSLVNKIDLPAFYLSGTYSQKTGTRTPSCVSPRQPTIHSFLCNLKVSSAFFRQKVTFEQTNLFK